MTRVYYKEAVGCFIVFDVTRASTFEAVQKWKNDLDSKVQLPDGSPIPCVLLANKVETLFLWNMTLGVHIRGYDIFLNFPSYVLQVNILLHCIL